MAGLGGGDPPPSSSLLAKDAFSKLLAPPRKTLAPKEAPKFVKKLDSIPEIALPEEHSIKIALALAERGLVG